MKKGLAVILALLLAAASLPVCAQGEVAELLFWDMLFGAADVYEPTVQRQIDQFNAEHPDIHVTVQFHSWDNYYQEYMTSVVSGMAPDVTNGYFTIGIDYAQMGEILDLSDIVKEWEESGLIGEFPSGSIEMHQYDGIQAGLPWTSDVRLISYNKAIFAEAGISEMPASWDEFVQICRVIKEKTDVIPCMIAAGGNHSDQLFRHMLFGNGVGITDAQGQAALNSEGAIETLKFFGNLMDEGLLAAGSAGYTQSDAEQLLANGEVAIWIGVTPTSIATESFIDNIGIMPTFASTSAGTPRGLTYCNPMVAFSQTKYPEACKIFLKWYIENSLPLFTDGGVTTLPVMTSQFADPYFSENPMLKQIIDNVVPCTVSAIWPLGSIPTTYGQIEGEGIVGKALQEVLTGNRNYESIAEKYNGKLAEIIEGIE